MNKFCIGDFNEVVTLHEPTDDLNSIGGFTDARDAGVNLSCVIEVISDTRKFSVFGSFSDDYGTRDEFRLWILTTRFRQIKSGSLIVDDEDIEYIVRASIDRERDKRFLEVLIEENAPGGI